MCAHVPVYHTKVRPVLLYAVGFALLLDSEEDDKTSKQRAQVDLFKRISICTIYREPWRSLLRACCLPSSCRWLTAEQTAWKRLALEGQ